jgi:RNA polymerase sigma-70 factor (sigma-E family)
VTVHRDREFTEYVQARLPWLRRIAFLLCQDWQRADDLVQTAITSLYVHWRRAAAMESTDGYARTILVHAFVSERRSGWARRVSLGEQVPEVAGLTADTDSALDVRAALAGLPSRQRAILVLRFYCDLSVEQAAQVLGCSPGTVKSQTSKALAAMRGALDWARSTPDGTAGHIAGRHSGSTPGRGGEHG